MRWSRLNPYQQGLHAWWAFWGDVLNGGLAQFFYNHTDLAVPALEELLRTSGCEPIAAPLEQATALYHEHREAFAVENPFGERRALREHDRDGEAGQEGRATVRIHQQVAREMGPRPIAQVADGDDGKPIDPNFSGTIQTHHPGGQLFEEAVIRRGTLSGPYRRYFEDGTLEHSCYYKAGEISADYWPGGQPRHKKLKRGAHGARMVLSLGQAPEAVRRRQGRRRGGTRPALARERPARGGGRRRGREPARPVAQVLRRRLAPSRGRTLQGTDPRHQERLGRSEAAGGQGRRRHVFR